MFIILRKLWVRHQCMSSNLIYCWGGVYFWKTATNHYFHLWLIYCTNHTLKKSKVSVLQPCFSVFWKNPWCWVFFLTQQKECELQYSSDVASVSAFSFATKGSAPSKLNPVYNISWEQVECFNYIFTREKQHWTDIVAKFERSSEMSHTHQRDCGWRNTNRSHPENQRGASFLGFRWQSYLSITETAAGCDWVRRQFFLTC